jgi:hypothetical protein
VEVNILFELVNALNLFIVSLSAEAHRLGGGTASNEKPAST